MTSIANLPNRAVISLTGDDRVAFLQGLTSNDVALAAPGVAVWSALLTPQGRWLADFFILSDGARLLLDAEQGQVELIAAKLGRFKLRSKVSITILDWKVAVAWGGAPDALFSAPDPRLPEAGYRVLSPEPIAANASEADWHIHRIGLGLPDGSADLEPERSLLLEAGFDELNGVSWSKGCYMGQELTARTKYRGLVKRRLVRVEGDQELQPGAILAGESEAGFLRSHQGKQGLAMVRFPVPELPLTLNGQSLRITVPEWLRAPRD